jgi:hypothetical protein
MFIDSLRGYVFVWAMWCGLGEWAAFSWSTALSCETRRCCAHRILCEADSSLRQG